MSLEQLLEQLESGEQKDQSASRTELNKRFSFPFSCLAFSLIAVPLGITAHRRETSMGFLLSLVVAFSYFLFIIMADTLRETPSWHPELLVWFPNLLFLGIGVWMFRRVARQ
jgi:lipopolysaccharide export system permease protein